MKPLPKPAQPTLPRTPITESWFGSRAAGWRHLRSYQIDYALPEQNPPALSPVAKPAKRSSGVYACGDYLDTASIQGAMVSGRRAAEQIIEYELYDCDADPLEMNNLAGEPQYQATIEELKQKLDTWMAAQGDRGVETELDALLHQGRFRGMTRAQALEAWSRRNGARGNQQPGNRNKKAAQDE